MIIIILASLCCNTVVSFASLVLMNAFYRFRRKIKEAIVSNKRFNPKEAIH